jgi:hypothetical protein
MPQFIVAPAEKSSISDPLRSIGESLFGDEAKKASYLQDAERIKRQEKNASLFAEAVRNNDRAALGYYGILAGKSASDVAAWNRMGAAAAANGNYDDPALGLAMLGAGDSMANTPEGQRRALASQRAVTTNRPRTFVPAPIGCAGADRRRNVSLRPLGFTGPGDRRRWHRRSLGRGLGERLRDAPQHDIRSHSRRSCRHGRIAQPNLRQCRL